MYEKGMVIEMAQAVNVNFRMDADLKSSMEKVCEDMGITMTTAFTIFAKKVSRERRIPFELTADEPDSREQIAVLLRRIEDLEAGRNVSEHELIKTDR